MPAKAASRQVTTAIGPVTIRIWPSTEKGGWRSCVVGIEPPTRYIAETYHEARSIAIWSARSYFGKPERIVGARLRFQILQRDGFRCRYCGATAAQERLAVDHAISIDDGGSNEADNLVTACEPCNLGKASRSVPVRP